MDKLKSWLMLFAAYLVLGWLILVVLRTSPNDVLMWSFCFGIGIWTYFIIRSLLSLTSGSIRTDAISLAVGFIGLWLIAILFLVAMYSYQYRYFGIVDVNGLDPTSITEGSQKITKNVWTCFYFAIVTWTTVGYGEFVPASDICRIFAALEALTGYVIMGVFISALINLLRPTNRIDVDKLESLLSEQGRILDDLANKRPHV